MKKGRKLPVIILIAVLLAASLGGGFFAGKLLYDGYSEAINGIASEFGFEIGQGRDEPASQPNHTLEQAIEIQPAPEITDGGYDTTYIYEMVNPSVVNITVYNNQSIAALGSGTGIVMTEDGYIITNAHVVDGGTSVNVTFSDETDANGIIIGMDTTTDLAIVKVDRKGLTPAQFGDSSALRVGERILAIGNAGGLSSTMTQGIVSGLDRDLGEGARSLKLIQVDAAINPGNSGGPLINRMGQVVGINSSKIASVEYEGIGFSIPASTVIEVVNTLMQTGHVARPSLGITLGPVPEDAAEYYKIPQGLYITAVQEASDAYAAGLRPGDILTAVNGTPVTTTEEVLEIRNAYQIGDSLTMTLFRDGRTIDTDVKIYDAGAVQ